MTQPNGSLVSYLQRLAGALRADSRTDAELLTRFIASRDEEAFTVLVGRYAALVWENCQRELGSTPDAEDAFQASFLVLARNAASVSSRDKLAGWLYRISQRIARNSRKSQFRRLQRETRVAAVSPSLADRVLSDEDRVVWEEVDKLPEKLRLPLVLYYLDGKTQAEAGQILGVSDRAVSQRLEQAVSTLRSRLNRRGYAITVAVLSVMLGRTATATAAPATATPSDLLRRVVSATVEGRVSPRVAALAANATASRPIVWIGIALVVLGGVCGAAVVALSTSPSPARDESDSQPANAVLPTPQPGIPNAWAVLAGAVTDADGRPVTQAKITVLGRTWNQRGAGLRDEILVAGTPDAQGRFRLPVEWMPPGESNTVWLVASTPSARTIMPVAVAGGVAPKDIAVRLVPGQVSGRVVGPNGQPLAGAMVRVVRFNGAAFEQTSAEHKLLPDDVWPPSVMSGPDGRFVISGLDPAAHVQLTIAHASSEMWSTLSLPASQPRDGIEVRMAQLRRISGCVIAADTRKPIANARVVVNFQPVPGAQAWVRSTITDAEGRYALAIPSAPRWIVEVGSTPLPYMATRRAIELPDGNDEVKADMTVERGVAVRGVVMDAGTGQPIPYGRVRFFEQPNPPASSPFVDPLPPGSGTDAEGRFVFAVPATGGILLATAPSNDYVLMDVDPTATRGRPYAAHGIVALAPGEPPETTFRLERGRTIHGRVLLPDGTPVPNGWVWCSRLVGGRDQQTPYALTIEDGRFAIPGCRSDRAYSVVLADRSLRSGAVAKIAWAKDPITVALQATGNATVDVRDTTDRPASGEVVSVEMALPEDVPLGETPTVSRWFSLDGGLTDKDGQKQLSGLVSGVRYRVGVNRKPTLGQVETVITVPPNGHRQTTLILP